MGGLEIGDDPSILERTGVPALGRWIIEGVLYGDACHEGHPTRKGEQWHTMVRVSLCWGSHYQIIAVLMLFGKYIVHGSYVCQGLSYLYWGWSSHL